MLGKGLGFRVGGVEVVKKTTGVPLMELHVGLGHAGRGVPSKPQS